MLVSNICGALAGWRARRCKIARLAHALRRVPAAQRTIYVMCAVERRLQAAVAECLEISVAEVQERLATALVALGAILDEEERPAVAPDQPSR